jgi:hypothetical protein
MAKIDIEQARRLLQHAQTAMCGIQDSYDDLAEAADDLADMGIVLPEIDEALEDIGGAVTCWFSQYLEVVEEFQGNGLDQLATGE